MIGSCRKVTLRSLWFLGRQFNKLPETLGAEPMPKRLSLSASRAFRFRQQILSLAACVICAVVLWLPNDALASIGQVTLSIGFSELQSASGAKRPVTKGDAIEEGDTVITSANGHVHLRFVDGGLVSVRPLSIFVIQEFKYSPQNPSAALIRFSLATGEIRSVSGAAAKAAPERFRLNTPIVAIGVRGTDFFTRSNAEQTLATVNYGAIVMTPFDTNCRPDALVGCDGQRARVLSADMTGLALVYRTGTFDPGYQSLPNPLPGQRDKNDSSANPAQDPSKQNAERALAARQVATGPEDLVSPSKLVWGRWASTPLPGDQMSVAFRDAMLGNKVTVGDGYFFLFRTPETVNLLPSLKTKADFNLTASAAFHRLSSGEIAAASVDSGRFSVDFAQRSYETQLKVSASGIPNQLIEFRGLIDPSTGIFLGSGNNADSNLAGALSLDGKQAGYAFRAPVGSGSLQGATLWGR
ncbi:MAG: hypothetical protein EB069_01800 [Actinobacteria bacterium]|nr:hypothetical protein [Actinomycetota bacterium]